ncbi:MAG: hypothetical protein CM15mP84_01800 [Cellvibrionales bacterium]|nr:MAG: hypothetical protein CM15mP84_01800 [Cellvibrionales bacterium]
MRGFPVSSGTVTAKASVVLGPSDFDKMVPGSILVSPDDTCVDPIICKCCGFSDRCRQHSRPRFYSGS